MLLGSWKDPLWRQRRQYCDESRRSLKPLSKPTFQVWVACIIFAKIHILKRSESSNINWGMIWNSGWKQTDADNVDGGDFEFSSTWLSLSQEMDQQELYGLLTFASWYNLVVISPWSIQEDSFPISVIWLNSMNCFVIYWYE